MPKANVYALELAGLADDPAAAIAAVTIGDAAGLTTGELGAVLRRLVLAHDPDAARKKRQRAEKDARVETWAEHAGTAALAGRDLPPADVLAADKNIDYYARQLKKAGTPGTLEFLRAQVFTALLTSRPLYTLLPGNERTARTRPDGAGARRPEPGRPCRRRGRQRPGHRRRGRPGNAPGPRREGCGPTGRRQPAVQPAEPPAKMTTTPVRGNDPGESNGGGGTRRPGPAPARPAAGPQQAPEPASRPDSPDQSTSPSRCPPGSA